MAADKSIAHQRVLQEAAVDEHEMDDDARALLMAPVIHAREYLPGTAWVDSRGIVIDALVEGDAMTDRDRADRRVPVIDGWFTWPPGPRPHLIGSRCTSCGDYFFPAVDACRNPRCMSTNVEQVKLSRKGKLYTYSINQFPAPPPYVPPDPFVPYATGVIELEEEQMKVHGQISQNTDFSSLNVGMEMEVVLETLYVDKDGHHVTGWRFKAV